MPTYTEKGHTDAFTMIWEGLILNVHYRTWASDSSEIEGIYLDIDVREERNLIDVYQDTAFWAAADAGMWAETDKFWKGD